jgi:pterin-4a-carbinolamine dehydratase
VKGLQEKLLTEIMQDYFNDSRPTGVGTTILSHEVPRVDCSQLPVKQNKTNWELLKSPRRLRRVYKFNDNTLRNEFVKDLLTAEGQLGHHAGIRISYKEVEVEVYTHDVNDVTSIDKEYALLSDQIYQDIEHYHLG